jgi:hypothetical protein
MYHYKLFTSNKRKECASFGAKQNLWGENATD